MISATLNRMMAEVDPDDACGRTRAELLAEMVFEAACAGQKSAKRLLRAHRTRIFHDLRGSLEKKVQFASQDGTEIKPPTHFSRLKSSGGQTAVVRLITARLVPPRTQEEE